MLFESGNSEQILRDYKICNSFWYLPTAIVGSCVFNLFALDDDDSLYTF